jgi:hypothetical protein
MDGMAATVLGMQPADLHLQAERRVKWASVVVDRMELLASPPEKPQIN